MLANRMLTPTQEAMNELVYTKHPSVALKRHMAGEIVPMYASRSARHPGRRDSHFQGRSMLLKGAVQHQPSQRTVVATPAAAPVTARPALETIVEARLPPIVSTARDGAAPASSAAAAAAGPERILPQLGAPAAPPAPTRSRKGGDVGDIALELMAKHNIRGVRDEDVQFHWKVLKSKIANRFAELRRCFRMIDEDVSGSCDRDELKFSLNAMWNLSIPEPVLDRMIDLADYDGDGKIRFSEFARLFSADDVLSTARHTQCTDPPSAQTPTQCTPRVHSAPRSGHPARLRACCDQVLNMKDTLTANEEKTSRIERVPVGMYPTKIKTYMSHFPPGLLVPVNDAWESPRHVPRKLTSSRGNRLEPPARPRHLGGARPANWKLEPFRAGPDARAAGMPAGSHVPLSLEWFMPELSPARGGAAAV